MPTFKSLILKRKTSQLETFDTPTLFSTGFARHVISKSVCYVEKFRSARQLQGINCASLPQLTEHAKNIVNITIRLLGHFPAN